jgi:ketosteroid isomerase-like protein
MSTTSSTHFDVEDLLADSSLDTFIAMLADDVTWTEVDQRTQPHAPAVYRGRAAVVAMLEDAHARGIVSEVVDGLGSGDRAAVAVVCTYPGGAGEVRCNALLQLRDGRIVRWDGVQAWDE